MEEMITKLVNDGFSLDQIKEIETGVRAGVDVSLYADKELLAIQMRQIRLGLQDGLDVSSYADRAYDWFQMEEIRKGLADGVAIELYAIPQLPYDKMQQIRLGLRDGIDLSQFRYLSAGILKQLRLGLLHNVKLVSYIMEGYDAEQLEAIREALEKQVDIVPYLDKRMRGVCIREICKGLLHGLDVSVYADPCYYWRQMREIRYGMEHMVDIGQYKNPYYDFEQMREIRLGLEEGLDVSYYSSLIYTAKDMQKRRLVLRENPGIVLCGQTDLPEKADETERIRITLEEDHTAAYVDLCAEIENLRVEIVKALHNYGITYGIQYDSIEQMAENGKPCEHVLVATGVLPENGKDGYYEYYFCTNTARTPKEMEDGSVDYRNVKWFEQVKKGQTLARYHHATSGKNGMTVTGREILARKGREQCILTGEGIYRAEDGDTYIASLDGIVSIREIYEEKDIPVEIQMNVTNLLTLKEVTLATGDINFIGNVFVEGNVGSGAKINATGDVLVNGFVETAQIISGGNILLRQGMNAKGEGVIQASGDVNGCFFEAAKIYAGGNIHGDYFLNCDLYAQGKICVMGKKGSLAGGHTCAEQGLLVNYLGNQVGLATYVRLGISDRLYKMEQDVNTAIQNVTAELDRLKRTYDEFMKKYQPQVCNTMDLFMKIQSAIYTKELELEKWTQERQHLMEEKKKSASVSVIVKSGLFEGVTVDIEHARWISRMLGSVLIKKSGDKIVVFSNR